MFCPRCAAQNAENASFCRACGANISLVPQALTGQLAEQSVAAEESVSAGGGRRRRRGRKEKKPATVEGAVQSIFIGLGFICVSLAILKFMPGGFVWWFWMLIPAFACLGDGVGTLLRVRSERQMLAPPPFQPSSFAVPPAARAAELPPRDASGLYAPVPSVTEGTTRHLGAPVERPPKDV